jgi:hypothetical protein
MNARNALPIYIQTPGEVNVRNTFPTERVPAAHPERVTDVRPERVTRAARNGFRTPGTGSARNATYYIILYTISVPERVPAARKERVTDVVGPWR